MASMAGMSKWRCRKTNDWPKRLLSIQLNRNENNTLRVVMRVIGLLKRKIRVLTPKSSSSEMNVKTTSLTTSTVRIPGNSACGSKRSESESTSGK